MEKFCKFLMIVLLVTSCRYDDTDILAQLQDHEARIARLETLVNQINTNVISLQTLLVALQNNDYVTSIAPINEGGVEIGYTLTFAKSDPITIYHGRDGKDGVDGIDGTDGANGMDGTDGSTPVIGVRQDEDGIYYWTLNGEWLTDDDGNKIPVTGNDGADGMDGNDGQDGSDGEDGVDGINGTDGAPGADGKDGITPQLKIEEDYWYVSYDDGDNWTQVGRATGDAGADGTDGKDGIDGKDGVDGDTIFAEIDSSNADYVVFTLTDGTVIKLLTWKAFEELQTKVNEINTNLIALQAIVEALQNNDYVTSITPITENRVEIGYVINFSKSLPVTIYHGKDGADGQDGENGTNGKDGLDGDDGQDGEDGHSPLISVKLDEDGIYYWTLDGEWLTDESGNRIPTTGKDGADGENGAPGQDGNDGVTPQLKIEDGYWWLKTTGDWQKLGQATGDKGDCSFANVSVNEWAVVFTLHDGTVFTVPRRSHMEMSCELAELKNTTAKFKGTIYTNSPDMEVGIIYSYTDTNVKKQNAHTVSTYEFSPNGEFTFVLENLNSVALVYYRTYVSMNDTYSYSDVKSFKTGNIALDGVPANCYIVTESGSYSFPTVRGNSSTSVGDVMSAEVLWESFGTSVSPSVGELIKSVSYSDGVITYQTADVFKEGNAVIAAKDASGVVLWSWHIWLLGDSMQSQIYANDAGVMMDRNLGATSATPGDVGALGLLYQWGRKDPFLGSSSISAANVAASTLTWPSAVSSSSSTGTVSYSIANPTKFIRGVSGNNNDWLYSSHNNELWSTYKSIYDPCPAGWRVPDGDSKGIWSKAGFDDTAYDSINRGILFAYPISTPDAWFPAAGYCDFNGGSLNYVGNRGYYWSATPCSYNASSLSIYDSGHVYPSYSDARAYGHSVRCLQE